jgi:GT2 family glycosyltransferase
MVAREFPAIHLIAGAENRGFAGGVNAALEGIVSDCVLVMNPDVELNAETVLAMAAFLERTPRAAAVAPLLRGRDGASQSHLYRRFPTRTQISLFWTALAPFSRAVPWLRRRWFEHDLRGNAPVAVDQLPGAAFMVSHRILHEVGPMDPDYFIWFEDVDWCYRARQAGYELWVLTVAGALHEGGASFRSWSAETRVLQFYRAFFRFLCKHRLDTLRRFALPVLTADLVLKQAVLTLARPFRSAAPDRSVSLAAARAAIRDVVARCVKGQLVRLTSHDVHDPAARARVEWRSAPDATPPMMNQSGIDVIIVNWNGRRFLPACIASLKRSSVRARIVVVDNGSNDGSVSYVQGEHPDLTVLPLGANVGYAAGANAGLRATRGRYAMIMNPDVMVSADHLKVLSDCLNGDASIGAAQGKLYQIAPEDFVLERVSPARIDSAGHMIRRSRMVVDRGQGNPDGPLYDREASVFSACGAALFLRRSMLEDIAPDGEFFGESFFAYKEDIDVCWRARLLGWDVRYVPAAVAHHVRAAPLDPEAWRRMPLTVRRHSWKNHYLLMIRNDRAADIVRALPFIAAWELGRLGHAFLRDPRVLRAYIDLARALPSALRDRRALLRRQRAAPAAMRRWFGAEPLPVNAPAPPASFTQSLASR